MSWKRAGELLDVCHRGPEDTAQEMRVAGRGWQRRKSAPGGPSGEVWRLKQCPLRGRDCRLEEDGVPVSRNSLGLMRVPKLMASKCKMKGFLRSDAQDSGKN